MLMSVHNIVCAENIYQDTVYKMPPCSELKEQVQEKTEIIDINLNFKSEPLSSHLNWEA